MKKGNHNHYFTHSAKTASIRRTAKRSLVEEMNIITDNNASILAHKLFTSVRESQEARTLFYEVLMLFFYGDKNRKKLRTADGVAFPIPSPSKHQIRQNSQELLESKILRLYSIETNDPGIACNAVASITVAGMNNYFIIGNSRMDIKTIAKPKADNYKIL